MNSSFDEPRTVPALATEGDGWSGTPALEWHRAGQSSAPHLELSGVDMPDHRRVDFTLEDEAAGVVVVLSYSIDQHGVVAGTVTVTSSAPEGSAPLDLVAARLLMPLPARATEVLDQTGRWTRERRPQRRPITDGTYARSGRRGRPGHDSPLVTIAGTKGFGFRSGELWSSHVAWSGNQQVFVERLPEGVGVLTSILGGGELLLAGEVRLGSGESYTSPTVLFAWGDGGIDSVSARWHGYARSLPAHPSSPRKLVLNTWEAVYFDHDLDKLSSLARTAASVGVERFVLDDGWFTGRNGDHSALGDWQADGVKWPDGLRPLSDLVRGLGMEFGLWFEPEMVNRDSDLARQHPDWILSARPDTAVEWRHQMVLDLTNTAAWNHILERISDAVSEYAVDFIKWDHNRDLHAAISSATGRASVRQQTLAVYALMDELRSRHPALEIESCASGGGRVDLGIMQRAQRIWASDTNDPIERQIIQRWTSVLVPPEVIGSHVGPAEAHTTHRVATLGFRLTTALFGHAGLEWDITACSEAELEAIRKWSALYRELRRVIHSGTTVRSDEVDEGGMLHGVVSPSRDRAIFGWVRLAPAEFGHSMRTRFPGLDPAARYRVIARDELGEASRHQVEDPAWLQRSDNTFSGRFLGEVGLPLPVLNPGNALLLDVARSD
jgi:alpha-galactosidase